MDATNIWGITGNWAEVYHACFAPTVIAPWVPVTLALAAPRPGERVLDVACGSGVVTRPAAQAVGPAGRVVGLDLSPEMLAIARGVNEHDLTAGAPTAIEWREGSADALPFDNGSFEIVICQLGLMFFPDQAVALREMRRVLAPAGRIALMTWGALDKCPGNAAMAQVWGKYVSAEQAARLQPPHSLDHPAAVWGLLEAAGFAQVDVCVQTGRARFPSPEALACGYCAMSNLQADAALRDAICAEMGRLLRPYCGPEGLDYPVEAVLARAQRPSA